MSVFDGTAVMLFHPVPITLYLKSSDETVFCQIINPVEYKKRKGVRTDLY